MEKSPRISCGARLDRLPDTRWHWSIFGMVAFALLVCWSNAIGGLVLARLKQIGWTDSSTSAVFTSLTTVGMFLGALLGGVIGDKIGRKKSNLLYEVIHIIAMVAAACAPSMTFLIVCRFVQGFGLGALLVVLFAGYNRVYTEQKSRDVAKPRFIYWQLIVSCVLAHCYGRSIWHGVSSLLFLQFFHLLRQQLYFLSFPS